MKILLHPPRPTWLPSAVGRERVLEMRWEPLLCADWEGALMMHYQVPAEVLRPYVPFELDLWEGNAYVSVVAFTMRDMAPRRGGWLSRLLFRPIATHEFLNVRTYVKHGGEKGIFFLAEWLPNLLSVVMGRPFFGLPYRWGRHQYQHHHTSGVVRGTVESRFGGGRLAYHGRLGGDYRACEAGTLGEFLMERYAAFTDWHGLKRRFRVWHPPWVQCEADVQITDDCLLDRTGEWTKRARFVSASYSAGHVGVWMGRPAITP